MRPCRGARWRVILGQSSCTPIGNMREQADRVDVTAFADWLVPSLLDHSQGYWLGDFGEHHPGPASSVLASLTESSA